MSLKLFLQRTTIIIVAIVIGFQAGYWTGFFTHKVEDIEKSITPQPRENISKYREIKEEPDLKIDGGIEHIKIEETQYDVQYKPTLMDIEIKLKRIQRELAEIELRAETLE